MAEVNLGDIVSTLRLNAGEFQRGIQDAIQSLAQFAQAKDGIIGNLSRFQQAFSQATGQANQQMQLLAQRTQQVHQTFQQFNQTFTQTNQQFNQVNITIQQFNQQLNQTNTTINQAAQRAQNFGSAWQQALQIAAGIGIATSLQGILRQFRNLLEESLTLAARMQELRRAFTAIEGSATGANTTMQFLFDTAQRVGVSVTTLQEAFLRFDAAAKSTTLSSEETRKVFANIVEGARALGSSQQQVGQALLALEQIMTKGRLSAEEYRRQLGNAIPNALQYMGQAFGASTQQMDQMVKSGLIPAEAAVVAFSSTMEKVARAAGPLNDLTKSFQNLKNEIISWGAAFGEVVGRIVDRDMKDLTRLSELLRSLMNIPAPGVQGPPAPTAPLSQQQFTVEPSPYTSLILQQGPQQGVDPGLLSRVIKRESQFNPAAQSKAGAIGLGQLMPETARMLEPGITEEQLKEPERNVRLAAQYLALQLKEFKNSTDQVSLALAAYNAGPGKVSSALLAASTMTHQATYADIRGRLPQETQAYVAGITGPSATAVPVSALPAQPAAAAPGGLAPEIAASYQRTFERVLQDFPKIKEQIDNLAQSGQNVNNILGKELNTQAQDLIQKFVVVAEYFARFPQEAARLTPELRAQLAQKTQEISVFATTLGLDEKRRDLLRSQTEQVEALVIQRKAELLATTQGQEAAERFRRQATQDLQGQRLDERPRLAALTLKEQIADYATRLEQLTAQANSLGTQVEAQRANLLRPQLEAELTRLQNLLAKPESSLAEQARQQAQQPYEQQVVAAQKALQQIATHPALAELREKFQAAFEGLTEAMLAQGQIAFEKTDTQTMDRVSKISNQIEQMREKIGAAGLTPLDADLARITRTFADMKRELLTLQQTLKELAPGATRERQAEIELEQRRIAGVLPQLAPAEAAAVQERRLRPETQYLEQLENRLEQLQTRPGSQGFPMGETREDVRLRQRGEDKIQTEDGSGRARELQAAILAQERLNYAAQLFEQFGNSVGQAWTTALVGIADGTKTVAQAFRDMARSIMMSLAQIASQEAWKALIHLGMGLIAGAAVGPGGFRAGQTGGFGSGGDLATTFPADGGGGGFAAGFDYSGAFSGGVDTGAFQHGGIVNRPTLAMIGERGPEMVLTQQHMQSLMQHAIQRAPTAGGQAAGITVINVPTMARAKEEQAREQALGRQTIINEVLSDLSSGEASRINRMIRNLQR